MMLVVGRNPFREDRDKFARSVANKDKIHNGFRPLMTRRSTMMSAITNRT